MVGAREHDARGPGKTRRLEHVEGTDEVRADELRERLLDRDPAEVDHRVDSLHRAKHRVAVGQVGQDEPLLRLGLHHPDVGQHELVDQWAQPVTQARGDRARGAGHQDPRG